ncbi:MAG TPA: hypothetical protein VEK57_08440 [Thermoanaerobaculia bacterium]|nr:hypothetical protein [Thermoanaerobaculia bacterium]
MKRASILLTLIAVMAFAPSAFACVKCNLQQGCYDPGFLEPGRTNCYFDGTCHMQGFCQGFTAEEPQLAATYTVAAVHVVEPETAKTPDATPEKTVSEPQQAELAVAGR